MRVWLVTGASRGFGREIARSALEAGDVVVATARRPEQVIEVFGEHPRLVAMALDVTDEGSVRATVAEIDERYGQIDVLVNNAGRGIIGAVEEVTDSEARSVFDVNVFGVLAVTRAVLPIMRRQRRGHVVMMSSMGGFSQPGSGWGVYGASKFALEGLGEALRNEVAPLGISVTLVEPGSFRTDFLDASSLQVASSRIADYDSTAGATRDAAADRNQTQQGDPVRAAAAVVRAVAASRGPLRLPLGSDAVAAIETKLRVVAADVDANRAVAEAMAHR
ncbi:MAG: oxidoreductase [Corynebacteriales bacterium]|nr:oxidoreductase [Mycobacteriales bacterium]